MFGLSKREKATKKLAEVIKGLEESYRKNAPKQVIRIGYETYELPYESLVKNK
jgi:hypothetical protein